MKLDSPTIYCLHRVDGVWAKTAFNFEGKVDRRRVKREIIKSFKRGGEVINPLYVDACIDASLKAASRRQNGMLGERVLSAAIASTENMEKVSIEDAEREHAKGSEASYTDVIDSTLDEGTCKVVARDTVTTGYRVEKPIADDIEPLTDEALDKAIARFEQQVKDDYAANKEILERDAHKAKNKDQRGLNR